MPLASATEAPKAVRENSLWRVNESSKRASEGGTHQRGLVGRAA
jgi:hypothetical protein